MVQNRIKESRCEIGYSKRVVALLLVLLQLSILITNEIPSFHNHSANHSHDSLHCGSDHLVAITDVPTAIQPDNSHQSNETCAYLHWNRTSQNSAEQLFAIYLIDQLKVQSSHPHQVVPSLDILTLYHSRAPPTV